jgi:Fe-S-cluster containining protein
MIGVDSADVRRLARHFGITPEEAEKRYTKIGWGERILRHRKDEIYQSVCQFLDKKTRRCSVYDARPGVCREYPDKRRCGYYEFLSWERTHQDDPEFVPLLGGRSF